MDDGSKVRHIRKNGEGIEIYYKIYYKFNKYDMKL